MCSSLYSSQSTFLNAIQFKLRNSPAKQEEQELYHTDWEIKGLAMNNLRTAHLFKSHLRSTYYVEDTMLGLGMKMNKRIFSALLKKLLWLKDSYNRLPGGC